MADPLTHEQRYRCMSSIHSKNTKPEVVLRNALWHQGFRYRKNDKKLPGSPDIVLPKYKAVVFVHGCFWHGHRNCKNYRIPKTNIEFWASKIARNQEHDQQVWRDLESLGWRVIIVWECELKKTRLIGTIQRVKDEIIKAGYQYNELIAARKIERIKQKEERITKMHKEELWHK